MAAGQITGRDAFVQVTYGGSSFNLSGDGNRSALGFTAEAPEKTAYQPTGGFRQRSGSGLKDWTFSFDGFWNDTDNQIVEAIEGAWGIQVVLDWGPAGSTSGYRKYSASGICTAYDADSPVDGMITATFEIVASAGSMTKATF